MENNPRENVKAIFDKFFNEEMVDLLENNMNFYKRVVDIDKLREKLKATLFDLLYMEFENSRKTKEGEKRKILGV